MKYQPYKGYGKKPWLAYGDPGYGHRIRTRGDWRYETTSWHSITGEPLPYRWREPTRRFPFWARRSDNGGSVWEKTLAHRAFRRQAKAAIRNELAQLADGIEYPTVSHAFRVYGDWLD